MINNDIPRCLRCKKIEYALNKNADILQIQEIFKEEPAKKIVNKSYDSIAHLSKSRLGESDSHLDLKQELSMTQSLPPVQCMLFIEEKMDGSNCAVVRHNGEIVAVGRSGYRCSESNLELHRIFHDYVEKRKHVFERLLPNEGDKVVGEWLALAHGTLYPDITNPYQVFDLFRNGKRVNFETRKKAFEDCGLSMVPLLYQGSRAISIDEAMEMVLKHNPLAEGVVYRLEIFNKKLNEFIPHLIAKVVRMDKEDGKYFKNEPIWLWKE